jgi:hypothetical protein
VSKFETGDAGSAEFELRCQKCGAQCQLANPAKRHEDHTEEACVKRARKAPSFKRQAVTSSIAEFTVNAQQQEAYIDGLVRAMATSCIPFTFMENRCLKTIQYRCIYDVFMSCIVVYECTCGGWGASCGVLHLEAPFQSNHSLHGEKIVH